MLAIVASWKRNGPCCALAGEPGRVSIAQAIDGAMTYRKAVFLHDAAAVSMAGRLSRPPAARPRSRPQGRRSLSVQADAAGLDDPRPLGDLAAEEFLEIVRRAAVGRDDGDARAPEPLLRRRRVQRLGCRIEQPLRDFRWRSLRKKEAAPEISLEIGQGLLLGAHTVAH